jgi:hypothetical protein
LVSTSGWPIVVFGGTRRQLVQRLRTEAALCVGALLVSLGAAYLALS